MKPRSTVPPHQDGLTPLIAAIEVGRLAALLRGQGLNRTTVEELLDPGTALKLRVILTEAAFPDGETDARPFPGGGAKVFAFRTKESRRR